MDVKTKIAMLPGIGGKPKLMNTVLNDLADHESQVYERQEIDQAITAALNPDTAVTSGSNALVTSGAVYTHVGDRIIDNLTSTDTNNALSANQGNVLNQRLNNLEAIGRFLSLWDCTTGLPTTEPPSLPYEYKTGDYFIISNVGTTNYKPVGTSYTGTASTTVVDEAVKVNDFFVFDGTTWKVLKNSKNDEVVLTLNEFNALTVVDPNTHYIITENADYVDLGLPSGTLWAKCNLGANSETEYGDYYMYGSTTPDTNNVCNWEHSPIPKSVSDWSQYIDSSYNLLPDYDAANVQLGGGLRMPTSLQAQELIDNTNHEWVTNYQGSGINGGKFTASNGNYIFIPAAGSRFNSSVGSVGDKANFWISTLDSNSPNFAYTLSSYWRGCNVAEGSRYNGYCVRPVR